MQKKFLFLAAVCLLFAGLSFVHAQTAAELEAVLSDPALSCAQAALFVASSSPNGGAYAGDGLNEAFALAMERRWFPKGTEPGEIINMGKLSFLLMKAFDIKGGLMYRIFPGPRYAFRSMVSKSYIQEAADPDMKASGEYFLNILGRVIDAEGGES